MATHSRSSNGASRAATEPAGIALWNSAVHRAQARPAAKSSRVSAPTSHCSYLSPSQPRLMQSRWYRSGLVSAQPMSTAVGSSSPGRSAPSSASRRTWLVIPGWSAVLAAGMLLAWLAGYPLLGSVVGHGPNWVLAAIVIWLSTLPWVPLVFLPRAKRFSAALEESRRIGSVTPALITAFSNRLVRAGHVYEYVAVIVLIYLMVAKPF